MAFRHLMMVTGERAGVRFTPTPRDTLAGCHLDRYQKDKEAADHRNCLSGISLALDTWRWEKDCF